MQAGKNISASEIYDEKSVLHPYRCVGGNGLRGFTNTFNAEGHFAIIGRQGALCGCLNMESGKFYATEHAVVVNGFGIIPSLFIYYFFTALNLNQYATATAQPGLAVSNIVEVFIPLPPLPEQLRIVSKIEKLLPLVKTYEQAQNGLNELNASLNEQLRKSILQEAIQGKLVPQIALTDSIIFKGDDNKYWEKNGKNEKDITDEIPFEIPDSWAWVRLSSISDITGGYAFQSSSLKEELGKRVIRISDISEQGFVNTKIVRYNGTPISDIYRIQKFDIIMAMTGGTVGKSLFVRELPEDELLLNQRVARIRNLWISVDYLNFVIIAPHIKEFISKQKNSTNDNISMADISNFLIPLPSIKEQLRIVEKLYNLASIMRG